MVTFAALAAAVLYLLPIAVLVFFWTGRRDVPVSSLALAIPNVVALDLLGILLLLLFVRLEVAVLVTRVAWLLVASGLFVLRRQRAPSMSPTAISVPVLRAVAAASAVALLLSISWSTIYSVWDRHWHVSLVASLRGQQLPFRNVYYTPYELHYHFSGDVLAATVQTLSFGVVHADHALSLAHDLMFALSGACLALLLWGAGHRSVFHIALAVVAVLFNGPVSILRGEGAGSLHGYSVLNFFTMSFRPHASLAGLLFIGFFGAVIEPLCNDPSRRVTSKPLIFRTWPTLVITVALLAITDETSTGMLGLSLGATWLVHAAVVHPGRRQGLLVLVVLLVAFLGVNFLFGGSLAPGGPVQSPKWVPWRSPGFFGPPVSLALSDGWRLLVFDMLALPLSFVGLLLCLRGAKQEGLGVAMLFLLVLDASAFFGLTQFEVNGTPLEAHRFATVALFAAPLFALAWLPRAGPGSPAQLLLLSALVLPALSTAAWYRNAVPQELAVDRQPLLGKVNCRVETMLHALERARPAYVAQSVWYLWGGCHPTLTPGIMAHTWGLPLYGPLQGAPALELLEKNMLSADDVLRVVCPVDSERANADAVCAVALAHGSCKVIGPELQRCLVEPADRPALLTASVP